MLAPALLALLATLAPSDEAAVAITNLTPATVVLRRCHGGDPGPVCVARKDDVPGAAPVWLCCPLMVKTAAACCRETLDLESGATVVLTFLQVGRGVATVLEVAQPGVEGGVRITFEVQGAAPGGTRGTASLKPDAAAKGTGGLALLLRSSRDLEIVL